MKTVWIVDDDRSIRWVLEKTLAREGISHQSFTSADAMLAACKAEGGNNTPGVLVCDIRMPGTSGLELLQHIKQRWPLLPVIIMTAYSDLESAVLAFQGGAYEYLPKPFDVVQALSLIQRALLEHTAASTDQKLPVELSKEILGNAPAMQEVFRVIGRLTNSHATVMITGESGSGKELVARALHRHSPRYDKAFVAINTAAIPSDLLESELFGHERGSFTGAAQARRGRFEEANGGTLFLDEIGDMPPEMQTRLLRVLSDGEYYRIGGHAPKKTDVRIIAATHQDLEARVQSHQFREDLYHRLHVIRLRLPALRERREDIPLLVGHFLQQSALKLNIKPKRIAPEALARLQAYDFHGNVRQLENLCYWLSVMSPGQLVKPGDLPPEFQPASRSKSAMQDDGRQIIQPEDSWQGKFAISVRQQLACGKADIYAVMMQECERILIDEALSAHGLRQEAAKALGIGRNTLTRKLRSLTFDK